MSARPSGVVSLRQAILAGDARAWGRFSDLVRERGGTYAETYKLVCELHAGSGRPAPTLADFDFDDKMAEADDLESGART